MRNPLATLYLSVGMTAALAIFVTWIVCYCKLLTGTDLSAKTPHRDSKPKAPFSNRRRLTKPRKYEPTRRNSLSSIDEEDSGLIDQSHVDYGTIPR